MTDLAPEEPLPPVPAAMNEWQRFVLTAGIVNSVLYLAGVFVTGLVVVNGFAWRAAIATAGVNYLAYFVQLVWPERKVGQYLVWGSIALGAAAGLALLF